MVRRDNRRSSLHRDTRGLSTIEYVILLIVVALIGIAAWRMFGSTAQSRAAEASGEMHALGEHLGGPAGGGAGGHATGPRTRLEEATGDTAAPVEPQDELFGPVALVSGAVLLVLGLVAKRILRKDGGKEGAEGEQTS